MVDTLEALSKLLRHNGAERIYAKRLSPNDNSKNQVYLGGDFSVLNIIPHGEILADSSSRAGSIRDRAKAPLRFRWVDHNGVHNAPNTQLILYPKYPEVRMSGFLKGCKTAPSPVMRSRDEGRSLFLGVTRDGIVLGYAAPAGSPLSKELLAIDGHADAGVLVELPDQSGITSRQRLLTTLLAVIEKNWIRSQKLDSSGVPQPYDASNGGGYTLEAELGISPNGYSEPDFYGWEIKQYGVGDFVRYTPKSPVTLLTPEPTGGFYQSSGIRNFIERYGYADKTVDGRMNFGGIYVCNGEPHKTTGLRLLLQGYDETTAKITDMDGGILMLDKKDKIAAQWKFTSVIDHWNRKHAKAAYVPSTFRKPPPEYRYGPRILICEGTDFGLFLKAVVRGSIYLDPALKLVTDRDGETTWKKRNQFRIKHSRLNEIYFNAEHVVLDLKT